MDVVLTMWIYPVSPNEFQLRSVSVQSVGSRRRSETLSFYQSGNLDAKKDLKISLFGNS